MLIILMPASDQGVQAKRYTLVPRTLIFITCGEQVLLLKGATHKRLWANRYNGLGGHIERGEDVLSAARRELEEEAALQNIPLSLCGVITVDTGQDIGVGIYVLRGEIPASQATIEASREGSLEWISMRQLASLPLVEDLPSLLARVIAMRPGDPPFSALYNYDPQGNLHIHYANG